MGRNIADTVSTLGSGVSGVVRRVETNYDTQGNVYQITSYDAATSGSVVNQIQRGYNGLGQLTTEYQATSGSVNTSTTPKVQYGYSEMSGGANHSRLTSMTYPNGRALNYNYTSGLDNNISRLSSISDGANTLESYQYVGYGSVVSRDHAQPGVNLSYIKLSTECTGDGGDQYTGLDRFGRVVDQRWRTTGGTDKDRFGYAYDRSSNRLYKENSVSASNSEIYSYDNLNQLTGYERGTLNGTKTGLTGSATRSQSWDFDGLGNFDSQTTNGVSQTRSHNQQNEITSISGATTPTYDANGNLTKDETGRTFKYDAWNRLVETKNSGGTTLATYKWDGAGRRVQETRGSNTTDLYYSSQWQVIEERVNGAAKFSFAWSPVYVDAMIARDRDTDNDGSLNERLYAMQDANFNMTALMDVSGNVVERYQYDPFGKFSVLDASWSGISSSAYAWNYLHQGGRWDNDAGVYSFRHRELNPTLGRWTTNDPIGFEGGDLNQIKYNRNNGILYLDPLGLKGCKLVIFGGPRNDNALDLERGKINNKTEYWTLDAETVEQMLVRMRIVKERGACDCFDVIEIISHGSPKSIGEVTSDIAQEFGKLLKPFMCKDGQIYLSGCNTGNDKGTLPQRIADGSGCDVFGSSGYLSGSFARNDENCRKRYNFPTYPEYPGAKDADGRSVWKKFPPSLQSPAAILLPPVPVNPPPAAVLLPPEKIGSSPAAKIRIPQPTDLLPVRIGAPSIGSSINPDKVYPPKS